MQLTVASNGVSVLFMKGKIVLAKESPAEIKAAKMAAEIRAKANKLTDPQREECLQHALLLIKGEVPEKTASRS